MSKRHLALLLALALPLAGCGEVKPKAPSIGFLVWRPKCEVDNFGLSPEQFTRVSDSGRVLHGVYRVPIPINCIADSYFGAQLQRYANGGDPVAKLAVAYSMIRHNRRDPCADTAPVESLLAAAASAPRSRYAFTSSLDDRPPPRARVPEAAFVLGQFYRRCGRPDEAERWTKTAASGGFDVSYAAAEAPDFR